ncbi:MAG TPA: TonB family protein [Anaeromyxobacter sp.]|nr:TonB family protein [Anaeromyxobacter sp.]
MSAGAGLGSWAGRLAGAAVVSAALHASGLALAARLGPRPPARPAPLEVAFEAVEPSPPPPEPPRIEPPPPPEPRPAPRRVAMAQLPPPPPRAVIPPPPPPPNEPPPEEQPAARAVPRVGISLSSTTSGGGFAVGVGNTLYGKAPEAAADPREVKPYSAEGTAPPPPQPSVRLSAQPRLLEQPEVPPYPEVARHAGLQGQVKLLLHIDRQGRVVSVRVLSDPGGGLGEAARAAALRFRFSPGLLDGEPVEVPDFPHTYTFVLE